MHWTEIVKAIHGCKKTRIKFQENLKRKTMTNLSEKIVGFIAVILVFMVSCAPISKESYMERYKEFIDEVKKESGEYDDDDWAKADEKYLKYSEEWYLKFESELTMKDEVKIASWNVQYNALRGANALKDVFSLMFDEEEGLVSFLREEYSGDVKSMSDDLKAKMAYYKKNQMEDDLNELRKAIKTASDSIPELVKLLK